MSKEYDEYLKEHIAAVQKAARWMALNLKEVKELSGEEYLEFFENVRRHDESKYILEDYEAYDRHFHGEEDEEKFNRAWLSHIHHSPHHWQHWILVNGYGRFSEPGVVTPMEMPKVYALEMVADWFSFSIRSGNLTDVFDWYERHKDKIVLHQETRSYVDGVLDSMRMAIEAEWIPE